VQIFDFAKRYMDVNKANCFYLQRFNNLNITVTLSGGEVA